MEQMRIENIEINLGWYGDPPDRVVLLQLHCRSTTTGTTWTSPEFLWPQRDVKPLFDLIQQTIANEAGSGHPPPKLTQ